MKKVILSISSVRAMGFLLQTVLGKQHTVVPAFDVVAGMKELKKSKKVDLIIIDVDGNTEENIAFIQLLKSSQLYGNFHIVALGSPATVEEQISVLSETNQIFRKPFSPQQLVQYVSEPQLTNASGIFE